MLVPATVFLVVGGLFAALWRVVGEQDARDIRLRSQLSSEQVAVRIKEKVEVCFNVLRQFREDWDRGQVESREQFEQRSESIVIFFPGIVALDLVDDSGGVIWAVPLADEGGQRVGRNVASNPTAREAFRQAASSDSMCVTPLLDLRDRMQGVVAYLPLRSQPDRLIGASVLAPALIESSLSVALKDAFRWVVYDGEEVIYDSMRDENSGVGAMFAFSPPFKVADRQWTVALTPLEGASGGVQQMGTHLILVLGLLAAAGVTFVSSRLMSSQERLRDNEERLRAVAEHIPGVVYSYESSPGRPRSLIYLGPGLDVILGPKTAARVEQRFDALFELLHPDDRPRIAEAATRGAARGETVDCEARLLTDDGSYRWIRTLSRPLIVDRDRTRWHIVLIDISEHRRALDALRESEERYRLLVESSPVGVMIHRGMKFEFVNPAAARLLGYDRAEDLIGQHVNVTVPADSRETVRERIRQLDADYTPHRYGDERLLRRDGTEIDVEVIASTIIFGGEPARQVLILDTSEQRQIEQRQRLLMQELDHRVKNNLASVLALLDQTAASTSDIEEFRARFANRIKAMARTHEMLARAKWSGVRMIDTIQLCLAPLIVEGSDRIRVSGPSLLVRPRSAVPLGLALHELATNALKYGSLSTPGGRIDISWTRENGAVSICWSESGGPPAQCPAELGVGLRLVRGLVEFELGGSAAFDFTSAGLACTLRIDAAALTQEPA
ncbi:MAG: PAS domain S-box protein [Phycisphaerales bacterium]|nr:PAS domain S-box protein [Phycisphaerales bacterium]